MKVGLNQWIFPDKMSLIECFQLAKKVGADGVEVNIYLDKGEVNLETPIEKVAEVTKALKDTGIEVTSILPPQIFPNITKIEENSVQVREIIERAKKLMDITKTLGADTILLVPGGLWDGNPRYDIAYRNASHCIKKISKIAEEKKVYLAIENVWNKFLLSPLEMCQFIDQFNSEYIKAYFDVGNILLYGFPEHWIEILRKRIKRVHVKDFKRDVGNAGGFVPLLAGDINWKNVVQSFKKIGYESFLTAELPGHKFYPEYFIAETVRTIRKIIEG